MGVPTKPSRPTIPTSTLLPSLIAITRRSVQNLGSIHIQARPVIRAGAGATETQQIPSGEAGHRIRHLVGTRECGCTRRFHEYRNGRPTVLTVEQLRASPC